MTETTDRDKTDAGRGDPYRFLPIGKTFEVIVVDPPWDYKERLQHGRRKSSGGAAEHYPCLTEQQLRQLPVKELCCPEGAIVLLWATGPQLQVAMRMADYWGLRYGTVFTVWDKRRVNPGYYTLSQCEFVLALVHQKIPAPRTRNERQLLQAMRRSHSEKPDEFYEMVDRVFPTQSKLDMFARKRRDGWHCWGDGLY